MKIVVVIQVSIKKAETENFSKLAKSMADESFSEKGCLSYKISESLLEENEFLFYEKYENAEALEKHNSSAHFNNFINSITPMLTQEPIIEKFDA
ncbi:antibiotic biosynthesis monooxygenase [Hyunsoonleella sp. SJ7]|uniref:Antibiotic biosynthesis monooxygenase n=1 Tax=Hyunsoonleella aquatilis TaxID=2762758 RepID=A0A923HGL7_9FLAO|nr:putative quinol monooxygenase [Hyunsoonleella aquatilis]MBC3759928.1 antibiotic biosynthesis monooxygenase [Hyunsoonleella aquatilis]